MSFNDKTRLVVLWVGSLVTLHTFVFAHITSVVEPMHIIMARSRVSKSCLEAELCFHRFLDFACVPIYTSNALAIRRTSLLWSSLFRCSVALTFSDGLLNGKFHRKPNIFQSILFSYLIRLRSFMHCVSFHACIHFYEVHYSDVQ